MPELHNCKSIDRRNVMEASMTSMEVAGMSVAKMAESLGTVGGPMREAQAQYIRHQHETD